MSSKIELGGSKNATQVVANLQRQQVQSKLIASDYLEANIGLMGILIQGSDHLQHLVLFRLPFGIVDVLGFVGFALLLVLLKEFRPGSLCIYRQSPFKEGARIAGCSLFCG